MNHQYDGILGNHDGKKWGHSMNYSGENLHCYCSFHAMEQWKQGEESNPAAWLHSPWSHPVEMYFAFAEPEYTCCAFNHSSDQHWWAPVGAGRWVGGEFPSRTFPSRGRGKGYSEAGEWDAERDLHGQPPSGPYSVPSLAHVPLCAAACGTVVPSARGPQGIWIPLSPAVID